MFGRFTATHRITEAAAAIAAPTAEIPVLPPEEAPSLQLVQELPKLEPNPDPAPSNSPLRDKLLDAKVRLHRRLIEEINLSAIEKVSEGEVRRQISALVSQYVLSERIALNAQELEDFVDEIIDEMTGLGPIEPLLKDPSVNDILINGHECVYVERAGMLEPTPVRFKDEAHLLRIVNKIVSAVGRRVDESQPLCDARLLDGSRINIAVRPIAVDGPLVSIRKFSKKPYNLKKLIDIGAIKPQMGEVLAAAVNARITLIISGGTGSGKTTMLNALSAFISEKERLVTIEDAAELQLQQPHVGRMETRPPNIEGKGEIRQRELVKNALRMRPDRIILGECRGEEAFDMLQAMNTGHEGSMATVHANTPRDAISRLEQMIGMAGMPMTIASVRGQIAAAIKVIVQLQRLSDGKRRVTSIAEITGLEGDILQMQEIFKYTRTGTTPDGTVEGHFQATGVRPRFLSELVARGINIPGAYFDPSKPLSPMPFEIDAPTLIVICAAISVVLFAEAVYLLGFSGASYRKNVNRRLKISQSQPDREAILIQLRRERGLTSDGLFSFGLHWFNRLILESGMTRGPLKLAIAALTGGVGTFIGVMKLTDSLLQAGGAGLFAAMLFPFVMLIVARKRRHSKFGAQFPDAMDIIVRSLRAGHPVPVAIGLVAQELADPIGTEFGIAADEITYGADVETAMRNLYFRVGQEDLPLFVTAVAIQGSTGGNLSEILSNLSAVIRQRFKMRRKIRALAAEGKFSALFLTGLPVAVFILLNIMTPNYYMSIWQYDLTKIGLGSAAGWMLLGNVFMYKMCNFRI